MLGMGRLREDSNDYLVCKRNNIRSPPRRGRGRSPDVDRWGGRGGRSRSRSPRRF